MSISLVFSGGKPCCNKKASKSTVSCKFNQAKIEKFQDSTEKLTSEVSEGALTSFKCNTAACSQCAKNVSNKPWWKFWAKKPNKNCPCTQTSTG